MSPFRRMVWVLLMLGFYGTLLMVMVTFTPEPKKLVKGSWIKMPKPDYWLQYLEWVSLVHGILCLILGGISLYKYEYDFNRRTYYWDYVCVANSLAYFIYDTIGEYYYKTIDAGMFAHHIAAISITAATMKEVYGAQAMICGLFFAEVSNQFFILRAAWRRMGLENTMTYQILLWTYAFLYIVSRGFIYPYNTYFITFALNMPFYMKLLYLPSLFLSHAWLVLILSMLWKSIPNWFPNPQKVENSDWWIKGRKLFKKYTKDGPWVYVMVFIIAMYSAIIPIIMAYYAHFVNRSWGAAT